MVGFQPGGPGRLRNQQRGCAGLPRPHKASSPAPIHLLRPAGRWCAMRRSSNRWRRATRSCREKASSVPFEFSQLGFVLEQSSLNLFRGNICEAPALEFMLTTLAIQNYRSLLKLVMGGFPRGAPRRGAEERSRMSFDRIGAELRPNRDQRTGTVGRASMALARLATWFGYRSTDAGTCATVWAPTHLRHV
jgi:hypothetical protein